jgi:hypothetical protein
MINYKSRPRSETSSGEEGVNYPRPHTISTSGESSDFRKVHRTFRRAGRVAKIDEYNALGEELDKKERQKGFKALEKTVKADATRRINTSVREGKSIKDILKEARGSGARGSGA